MTDDEGRVVDGRRLRSTLAHVPTPVTVVTAMTADGPVGVSIGSFFSVSLEPPLVGWCVGRTSASWPAIRGAGRFCVNVLAGDQATVCQQFAAKDADRFAGMTWQPTLGGAPRLDGAVAWLDCAIEDVHAAGDHEICIGRVHDLGASADRAPLVFSGGRLIGLGSQGTLFW